MCAVGWYKTGVVLQATASDKTTQKVGCYGGGNDRSSSSDSGSSFSLLFWLFGAMLAAMAAVEKPFCKPDLCVCVPLPVLVCAVCCKHCSAAAVLTSSRDATPLARKRRRRLRLELERERE